MIAEVVSNSGTLEFRSLAGASAAGLPVGSILALHTTRVPAGYLPCNGAVYDITQYPALYTILQTNVLPDLREANLVGAGANSTHSITTHDTYTVGQFKDDQVQTIPAGVITSGNDACDAVGVLYSEVADSSVSCYPYRTGATTHGKNYGVFFVIKAVTGITELDDAEVYAQVVNLLESNYIQKSLFSEGGIPMYNSTTECFDQITPPSTSGKALTYDPATCCYCWGETASAVSNLTDVCLTNLCDGQYLQYDATNCTWNNVTLAVDSSCISCCDSYVCVNGGNNIQITGEGNWVNISQMYNGLDDYCSNIVLCGPSVCMGICDDINGIDNSAQLVSNCFKLNGNCSACYDFQTGVLYVHAICFI